MKDPLWDYLVSLFDGDPDVEITVTEIAPIQKIDLLITKTDDGVDVDCSVDPPIVDVLDLAPGTPNTVYPFEHHEGWN